MASTKEIRSKIKSVQNTRKITKAMEMVAASKMRRAQERMRNARPYAEKIREIVANLSKANPEFRPAYMATREVKKVGTILVTTDKGLCGGLNTNVLRLIANQVRDLQEKNIEIAYTAIGSKGLQFLNRSKAKLISQTIHRVQEVDNYESLFRLVARGRIDPFCRGANEILSEWKNHRPGLPGLTVDSHVALFYPLIHSLYSHATYSKERERLLRGLQLAWKDGSLQRLWRQHFQPSLVFARLDSRQIFRLTNPQLPDESTDYRSYLYDPMRDDFGIAP